MPIINDSYGSPCASSKIITVKVDLGASGVFYVSWRRDCVVPLVRAAARIKAYNVDNPSKVYRVTSTGFQTYNCRHIAGSSSWSNHAWPVAVDINPPQNRYGTWQGNMPQYFKDAFRAEGFTWLPDVGVPDPMHFEHPGWDGGRTSPTSWDYHDFLEDDFMGRYTEAELDVIDALIGKGSKTDLTKDGADGLRNLALGGLGEIAGDDIGSGDGDWRRAGHAVIAIKDQGSHLKNFAEGLEEKETGKKGEYHDAGVEAMKVVHP